VATTITFKTNYKLPRIEDGVDALLEFAEIFGDAETFTFLGRMKDTPARQAREILAARMILAYMRERKEPSYTKARLHMASHLGYEGNRITNFNKLANDGKDVLAAAGQWDVSATVPAPRPHS
jgi:hypothetical protein